MGIAIGDMMAQVIERFARTAASADPQEHLKDALTELSGIAMENQRLMGFVLSQSLTSGDMDTPLHLVPFLRNLLGEEADERNLRVIALQILSPLQVAALSPDAFKAYSGFDLENAESRKRYAALLVDNLTLATRKEPR